MKEILVPGPWRQTANALGRLYDVGIIRNMYLIAIRSAIYGFTYFSFFKLQASLFYPKYLSAKVMKNRHECSIHGKMNELG
ncbi:MAG: hypothetical protein DSZ23_05880 [Thermodesulfatator sp.]|nr:MAG: hypothetical protein DSZ23_05880 [Thermodesulfatator sp.]